jgi:hypothetical protein
MGWGHPPPNAVEGGGCVSLNGPPVLFGQCISSFALENDVALFKEATYATIPIRMEPLCLLRCGAHAQIQP